jgi:N-acetyl-beta-hexosaminidase
MRSPSSILLVLLLFTISAETVAQQPRETIPVIPAPLAVERRTGECVLSTQTYVITDSVHQDAAKLIAILIGPRGKAPRLAGASEDIDAGNAPSIVFLLDEQMTFPGEYRIVVTPRGITVRAGDATGGFHAAQTLRQLLPPALERGDRARAYRLPCMEISDRPRFSWRGVLLDCARHFIPVMDLKRMIDRFAMLKFNRLHWHLTDDQGWRLEVRAYPLLTGIGGWRGTGPDRYGGFYTQDEVRDIVAYASERHIVIVPEIDLPAHSGAALAAYPDLDCFGRATVVQTEFGQRGLVLCAGREFSYSFVRNALAEVAELFPSPWIHVGGDEIPLSVWESCDSCRTRMLTDSLQGTAGLRGYFTRRVSDIVRSLGKIPIGWNEVLHGAPPDMIIQAWHGMAIGTEAAGIGHEVICSPNAECYFDYSHKKNSLEHTYGFDPLSTRNWPGHLPAPLGVECCLWTEWTPTPAIMEQQLFPRVAAFSEVAWSDPEVKNFDTFTSRLAVLGGRWQLLQQVWTILPGIDWDDGLPLTVDAWSLGARRLLRIYTSAAVQLDGSSVNGETVSVSNSVRTQVWLNPVGDRTLLADLGYSTLTSYLPDGIRGVYKRTNPWSELCDSVSVDALYRFPVDFPVSTMMDLNLYPNPLDRRLASSALSVTCTLVAAGCVTIMIHDCSGRCVRSVSYENQHIGFNTYRLPLTGLPAGSYMLLLRNGVQTARRMLVLL